MDMTTYIPTMTPYVTVSLPIMPLVLMMIGMYMCFSIRSHVVERGNQYSNGNECVLQEKEREIRTLREEICRLHEQMREKEKEYHHMIQSFTNNIVSLSEKKIKSEEGLHQTSYALQETFQQTTHTFKDAIEQMKSQHSALMETQGKQIQSLKEEISTVRHNMVTVEKIMTCAIHFIRNRAHVYQEFIELEGYVVKSIECEYPHLSFNKLELSAPALPDITKPVKRFTMKPPTMAKPVINLQE